MTLPKAAGLTMAKSFTIYWGPVLLLIGFIFTVSSLPVEAPAGEVFWPFMAFKKLIHVGEYALLALLSYRAFKGSTTFNTTKIIVWSLILVLITAIFDEYRQDLIPGGGTAHLHDVMIDLFGALVAYILLWKLVPIMPRKLKNLAKLSGLL